ncbi:MAG: VCBS repeat-containing protein [Bacteroidales bacterium]|nr:VCBS repeat-containing protein [Bacteroidales bacterium]
MIKSIFLVGLVFASVLLKSQFVQVTQSALGLPYDSVSGMESVAWPDYNNDGYPDLFVGSKYLYKNNQNGTFSLIDPTVSGFSSIGGVYFSRATFADADNDGDLDFAMSPYYSSNWSLYFKNAGAPNYNYVIDHVVYVHETDVLGGQPTFFQADTSLSYELYLGMLGNWPPDHYAIGKDRLMKMDYTTGMYQDITATAIPQLEISAYRRPTRGNNAADYDNDGDIDLFVPVYGISTTENHQNILWKNNGNGTFTDNAVMAGVSIHSASNYDGLSSAAAWGDYNNDGFLDLAVPYIHGRAVLYKNLGNGNFAEVNSTVGLQTAQGEYHNPLWIDYDNDGDLDLFFNQWYNDFRAKLYRNEGPANLGTFTLVTNQLGFNYLNDLNYVTGWATADYDKDGDMDMAYYNASDNYKGVYLWRNDFGSNGNNWLIIRPKGNGTTVNQNALGTKAQIIYNNDSRSPVMQMESSSCDQGMNMQAMHFGLGDSTEFKYIKVDWPDGSTEYFFQEQLSQPYNAWVEIIQGNGSMLNIEDTYSAFETHVFYAYGKIDCSFSEDIIKVELYDLTGRLIQTNTNFDGRHAVIALKSYSKGVYVVKVFGKSKTDAQKVLIF